MNATFRRIPLIASFAFIAALVDIRSSIAQSGVRPGGAPSYAGASSPSGRGQASLFGGQERKTEVFGPSLAATDEMVIDIRVEGNKTIPSTRITSQMQTRIGRAFDPTGLSRDVRKLASTPWFISVKPFSESTPEGRVVILRVVERPTIRYIEYLGNSKLSDKRLKKESGLVVGAAMDPYLVDEGRRKIELAYIDNGYARAQVGVLEGDKAGDKGVVYVINEGVQQKISAVRFEGNDSNFASDRRLKTKIKSKPGFLHIFGGKVNREKIDADVNALTAYYRSFGFFQARVGRVLDFDDRGRWATLRFVIHEGPRYNVRNVRFLGNEKFSSPSLSLGVKMPAGEPFEQAKMNSDVEWLKEVYGSQGYVFADVKAEPVFLTEPGQIDLVYHIEEGKRWRVGRIFVHIDGDNSHTRIQTALNRLSIRPGEILDIRELRASERRLQASSLFAMDPSRGVGPKITYRIPELDDAEFTASNGPPSFRGQNPSAKSPRPDSWIVEQVRDVQRQVYEAFKPVLAVRSDRAIDVHLALPSPEDAPRPAPVLHTAHKPPVAEPTVWRSSRRQVINTAYQGLVPNPTNGQIVIRGQSPAQPVKESASHSYGGVAVGATDPTSAPVNHRGEPVQQAQFTSPPRDPALGPLPPDVRLFPNGEFGPPGTGYPDPAVDLHVNLEETQTGRFMVGVGVNSDAGVVGQILIDERNFDWRRVPGSWRDFYEGTAFRGAGQRLRIEAAPGTQVQRYMINFQEPYLWDTPISFSLSGSFFDRRYDDWDEQRFGGQTAIGYQWTANDLSASVTYRGYNVNIHDPVTGDANFNAEIAKVQGDNALHGFGVTIANDTRNNPFLATEGYYAQVALEQVVGSFEYPRVTTDFRKYFLLSERPDHSGRHVLVAQTRLGFTGSNTPIYDRFFAGGYSTFRGFDFRRAGPMVGGDFSWLNTLEYMFPLTADDMINGVVFCDFGTVEEKITTKNFRVSPGVGLRIQVPAMGPAPIALDFAWPVEHAVTDELQVFTFNVGFLR